jgi:hypothetical protein
MLYIIFTDEGLAEASQQVREEKAGLWLNPGLKNASQISALEQAGIEIHYLPEQVDANNDKAVLAAMNHVEQQCPKTPIYIELV